MPRLMHSESPEWREYRKKNFRNKNDALNVGEASKHEYYTAYNYVDSFMTYTSFKNVKEYLKFEKKFEEGSKHFFECIRSNKKSKVYFDLDNKNYVSEDKAKEIIKKFTEDFTKYIKTKHGVEIDEESYRIADGSGLKKTKKGDYNVNSFHVILNDHFVMINNNEYMQQLYDNLMEYYEESKPEWYDWIDGSVYTKDRLFRCLNNKKCQDTGRFFRKTEEYPEEDYFITNIDQSLPILDVKLKEKNRKNNSNLPRMSHLPSKQYEKRAPEEVEKKAEKILEELPYYFVKEHQYWAQICWILKSIHPSLFEVFNNWSQKVMERSENKDVYNRNDCIRLWNQAYKGCNGFDKIYKIMKDNELPVFPDEIKYGTRFYLMYEHFPRYPLAKTIDNDFYNFDKRINEDSKFIKPEDFDLPTGYSKYTMFVKAHCGSGKSDQTLALCANLVEKGFVPNGIICLAPNKTLVDSLHQRFSGQRLVKSTDDIYIPTDDPSWKMPHGHHGMSPKDIGMIHYQDPEYEKCLAPKDGSPINVAICINSIRKLHKSKVDRQLELRRELLESMDIPGPLIEDMVNDYYLEIKNKYIAPTILILDETFSFLLNLSSETMSKTRREIMSILKFMIQNCTYLICLDASINDEVIDIIKSLRPDDGYTRFVWYKKKSNEHLKCYEVPKSRFIDIMDQKLAENKKIFICNNLKKHGADFFESYIRNEHPHLKILSITSDTSVEQKRLSSNADHEFKKYDVVIVSPSVIYGLDFSGDHFDCVFGYYKNHTIGANMCYQQLRRIRNPSSNELFVCYDNLAYDNLTARITEKDIDQIIDNRTKGMIINEEDIYEGYDGSGDRKLSLYGKIYRQIIKFELESSSNFSSWVRSYLCDEGIRYFSEAYKHRMPEEKLRKLKQKIKQAKKDSELYQWAIYNNAPDYEDEHECEDPVGAAKLFHKVSFNLQKIDQEFFQKFIESKHYDKLENLKMFLCDELDIEDVYTEQIEGEEKEMVKFMDARKLILKLLNMCCDGKEDIKEFVASFKTGDSLGQTDFEWIEENHKTIRVLFGECGRLRDKRKKCPKVPQNKVKTINHSCPGKSGTTESDMEGEEANMRVFESKKAVTGLLARILKQYLGLSITSKNQRRREDGKRVYETTYKIEEMDEIFELLMYMDARYGKSDKFTEFIKNWGYGNKNPCKWYHLYDPSVAGRTIEEAAKGLYELEMVEEEDDYL